MDESEFCLLSGDQFDSYLYVVCFSRCCQHNVHTQAADQWVGAMVGKLPVGVALAQSVALNDWKDLLEFYLEACFRQTGLDGFREFQVGA